MRRRRKDEREMVRERKGRKRNRKNASGQVVGEERLSHILIRLRYDHIFSSRSSKFHLWCAEMGTA